MNYDPRIHHRRSIRLRGYDYSRSGAYFVTINTHSNKRRFGRIVPLPGQRSDNQGIDVRHKTWPESSRAEHDMFSQQNPNIKDTYPTNACIELNECGQVAYDEWLELPARFPNCELGVFQIMPDHMHGIVIFHGMPVPPVGISLSEILDAPADDPGRDADGPAPGGMDTVGASLADAPANGAGDAPANGAGDAPANGAGEAPANAPGRDAAAASRASARDARTMGDIVGAYKSLVFNGCLEIYKARDERMGKLWHRNYYENIIRSEESFRRISNYIINNPGKWMKKHS